MLGVSDLDPGIHGSLGSQGMNPRMNPRLGSWDPRESNGDGDEKWDRKSRRFTDQKFGIKKTDDPIPDDGQTDRHVTTPYRYIDSD